MNVPCLVTRFGLNAGERRKRIRVTSFKLILSAPPIVADIYHQGLGDRVKCFVRGL